jgi:magnesium-transporting ATPase (P-type)
MANLDRPSHGALCAIWSYEQLRRAENDDGDLEWGTAPMEEVFLALESSPRGLTSATAASRLAAMGAGEARTWKQSRLLKLVPLAVEATAAVALAVGLIWGGGHEAVAVSVVALIAADFITGFAETSSAEGAVAAALLARLAPPSWQTWVRRDGVWSEQEASALVPGDVIRFGPGDVAPADAVLLVDTGYSPRLIRTDQSALTGDPAPAAKLPGNYVYAGSLCVGSEAEAEAVVVISGAQTHLQQAVLLADATIDNLGVWILGLPWNAGVVAVCFNFVADVVAGRVSDNLGSEIVAMVVIACIFTIFGCMVSLLLAVADQPLRRRERDPRELMRRLEGLRQNGSISEETLQRCRDLFGAGPVSDELVATLAEHFGWRVMRHEDSGDGRAA